MDADQVQNVGKMLMGLGVMLFGILVALVSAGFLYAVVRAFL